MNPLRLLSAVIGVVLTPIALALLAGGVTIIVAYGSFRDEAGFISSPNYAIATDGYAISTATVDLGSRPGDWLPFGLKRLRIGATGSIEKPVFVGIGPASMVGSYLSGVAGDTVVRLGREHDDVGYQHNVGSAPATPPGVQDFWVLAGTTSDFQSMTWDIRAGDWLLVVMNADGSRGVTSRVSVGAGVPLLFATGIGIIVGALVVGGLAAFALTFALRGARAYPPAPEASGMPVPTSYPVALEGTLDPRLSRGLWLVKWILAIPHFFVLAFLWMAFVLLTLVAFFVILVTGRYPRPIFEFNVGVLRWTWRVVFYAYAVLGTDRYPPFSLADDPSYPARLNVAYPERLSRGLVLVKSWLLAIPHLIIVGFLTNGLIWLQADVPGDGILEIGGGLIGMLALISAVILLFSGRYPQAMFDLLMGLNRWVYRVAAYVALMRDEYPPFQLDLGGSEGTGAPALVAGGGIAATPA